MTAPLLVTTAPLLLTLAVAACRSEPLPEAPTEVIQLTGDTLHLAELIDARRAREVLDDYGLFRPRSFTVEDGHVYVADSGNRRVVIFDTTLAPVRAFGAQGEGPAEFMNPVYLAVRGDSVFVFDQGNPKVSVFTAEGEYVRSRRLETSSSSGAFVILAEDRLAVASSGTHRLAIYTADAPAARLESTFPPDDLKALLPAHDLLVLAERGLVFVDNWNGRLMELAPDFAVLRVLDLPESFHAVYRERVRRALEALGSGAVLQVPYFMSVQALEGDRILLFLGPRFPTLGMIVDLRSGSAVELVMDSTSIPGDVGLWRNGSLVGDRLFVMSGDGDLLSFAVRPSR